MLRGPLAARRCWHRVASVAQRSYATTRAVRSDATTVLAVGAGVAAATTAAAWAWRRQHESASNPDATRGNRVVLISGNYGSGKTTLAEQLHHSCGFIHFDSDRWVLGLDPLADQGSPLSGDDFKSAEQRAPELQKVRKAYKNERQKALETGIAADAQAIEIFYKLLAGEVQKVRAAHPGKNVVIPRPAWLREERDVFRKLIGEDLFCVMLCVPAEVLAQRKEDRARKEARQLGKTFEEHVMSVDFWHGTFDERLKSLRDTSGASVKEGAADEPNLLNVQITEVSTKESVFKKTAAFLGL